VSAAGSALVPRLVLRPGSARVSRDMPVRLGLCASRANELLIGFPIQRFNVLTNHPDAALACAYSSDRSPRGGGRCVRVRSPASWVGFRVSRIQSLIPARVAHASRVLVSAASRNGLFCFRPVRDSKTAVRLGLSVLAETSLFPI